jgi:hypothetical protein
MSRARSMRAGERGAALLMAVAMAAVLSVVAGGVGLFALADLRIAAAGRDHAEAAAAADAALEIAVGRLAEEPDLAAVRAGAATAARPGSARLATLEGELDVDGLTRGLVRARGRLPPPWGAAVWRPYLWGRMSEVVDAPDLPAAADPLIVVWVRGDVAADAGADRLELAVEAVTPRRAVAGATALVARRTRGLTIEAVWPDLRPMDPP